MTFEFLCPDCSKSITAPKALVGQKANCPGCGKELVIPNPLADGTNPATATLAAVTQFDVNQTVEMSGQKLQEMARRDEAEWGAREQSASDADAALVELQQDAAVEAEPAEVELVSEAAEKADETPPTPTAPASTVARKRGLLSVLTIVATSAVVVAVGLAIMFFVKPELFGRGPRYYQVRDGQTVVLTAIPRGHVIGLDESLDLGNVRVTALSVERKTIRKLQYSDREGQSEATESDAPVLVLNLKLKNISTDETFAPLDMARVRNNDNNAYISMGDVKEYLFEISVRNDATLEGQSLDELQPGEEVTTLIASNEKAATTARGQMTWRVEMFVNAARAATVFGVTFNEEDIQETSSPPP